MKFIIIPTSELLGKEQQLKELDLDPRRSIDDSEVILHIEHYDLLYPKELPIIARMGFKTDLPYTYPTYENPSSELSMILDSPKWMNRE